MAFADYAKRLGNALADANWIGIAGLGEELRDCWRRGRQVFLCGNGGSAANAIHLANDLLYGISKQPGSGLRVHALPANTSVISCLANDEGYEHIFALQLAVQARQGDVLIALSGSGNSANIVRALKEARRLGMRSYAILGYSGGQSKGLADVVIHFPANHLQVAEALQLLLGHMVVEWLYVRRTETKAI